MVGELPSTFPPPYAWSQNVQWYIVTATENSKVGPGCRLEGIFHTNAIVICVFV